ncbi:hypothetical protein F2Q70_00007248 [Brassica cretica]|uniref:inorganic diphosphatase n=1 Tax=Brassica cretica TaxID=69181 RepID=A0A8S9J6C0_BRACR|nr:hypothetical protein F2Q68_00000295 [Brassica cretica]KAF2610287.1 hypothetical protein F2Q70_00007248 [Brassica cretica]
MAATRLITAAYDTSCLLAKRTFLLPAKRSCGGALCFNRRALVLKSKRPFSCSAIYNPQVKVKEEGQPETLDYRVFFLDGSGKKVPWSLTSPSYCLSLCSVFSDRSRKWVYLFYQIPKELNFWVSPWHDIPLTLGAGVYNFIVEIPKESKAKMEVATDEDFTPIKQDTKKGKLRYYPYNINWNYGLLPQTWEDPYPANAEVEGAFGDNDPVDVVEIGETQRKIGEVVKIKPLAALAMIDEGELDWKIVAISLDDPKAHLVNDVDDVEKHFPGTLTAIRDWFRDYKIPDGNPANTFGLGDKPANKDYALKIIHETNKSWAKLVKRSVDAGDISLF